MDGRHAELAAETQIPLRQLTPKGNLHGEKDRGPAGFSHGRLRPSEHGAPFSPCHAADERMLSNEPSLPSAAHLFSWAGATLSQIGAAPGPRTALPELVITMRRLHLKLFFLRTRLKREAQGVTAKTLGVRPATMSHLEQGRSLPTLQMLLALCRHYDVTPTYLLDDSRPIEPTARDRWSERDSLVARGNWLEVPEGSWVTTNDGVRLCPVRPGARFYDASAQAQRMTCRDEESVKALEEALAKAQSMRDQELEAMLTRELLGQRKPRNKKKLAPSKPVSLLRSATAEA
ncbi:MAG: hypothetical protein Fur0037_25330 [Planctomycetota bacterium]